MFNAFLETLGFVDFDRAGRVRVTGLPPVGIKMKPVVLNIRLNGETSYDVGPILRCIYRKSNKHGIQNKFSLARYSWTKVGCELRTFDLMGNDHVTKEVAIKIIKLAYELNSGCVTGLEHY